jgi:hypothetical protein
MRTGKRAKRKVATQPLNGHTARKPAARRTAVRQNGEKNIFAIIGEIGGRIPEEELLTIPKDLSINLDHYLYGVPKVEPWKPV